MCAQRLPHLLLGDEAQLLQDGEEGPPRGQLAPDALRVGELLLRDVLLLHEELDDAGACLGPLVIRGELAGRAVRGRTSRFAGGFV